MISVINKYIARQFFLHLMIVITVVIGLIVLFDVIELTRVAASRAISFEKILIMSLQKTLLHLQKIIGFLILIASVITYSKFAKTSELIVFKTSGLSIWRLLIPTVVVSFCVGAFFIGVISPLTAYTISKYERAEAQLLKGSPSLLSLSKTGLWIMQTDSNNNESIIHALRISQNSKELYDVTFYYIDDNKGFVKRIDGLIAELKKGFWQVHKAYVTKEGSLHVFHEEYIIPTNITFDQIQESLTPPESLSFWKLPNFINIAENSGLSATKHRVYYFKLLVMPLFFVSMLMLGTAFSLTVPRFGKNNRILILIIGFAIYFLTDLITAMGIAGSLPVFIAAILPTIFTSIIGLYFLIHFEESKI